MKLTKHKINIIGAVIKLALAFLCMCLMGWDVVTFAKVSGRVFFCLASISVCRVCWWYRNARK